AVLLAAPPSLICSRASSSTRQLPSLPSNALNPNSSPISRKWALSPCSKTVNPYRRRFFPKDNRRRSFTNGRVASETVVRGSIKHFLRYRRGVWAAAAAWKATEVNGWRQRRVNATIVPPDADKIVSVGNRSQSGH